MSLESEKEKYLSDLKQNIRNTVKAKVDAMADDKMREKGYIEKDQESSDGEVPHEGSSSHEEDPQEHDYDEDSSSK